MKYVRLLLLVTLTWCAHAAPPPVYPGEVGSSSRFPIVVAEGNACAVVWFYDSGHQWTRVGLWGAGDDCKINRPELMSRLGLDQNDIPSWILSVAVGAHMLAMTHVEKDAMWNAVFSVHPGDPNYDEMKAAADIADAPGRALFDAVPVPTIAPPSGYVTQKTIAYKRSEGIGTYTVRPIGAVPVGIACNSDNVITDSSGKQYHALMDRTKVAMTKAGNFTPPLPTTAYGVCRL